MKTVVIGGRGLLGSDVGKAISGSLVPTRAELDLNHQQSIENYLSRHKPDFVINCGAISNVDRSEIDSVNPFLINSAAVYCLAQACKSVGSTLVHISTDYVYPDYMREDGKGWSETDSPSPTSTYGKIKLSSEALAMVNPNTYVLRVSSLYGSGRSCHSEWVLNAIKENKTVRICDDMVGSPTYTADLAQWIKSLLESTAPYGIYNCVPDGHVSRYQFAETLVAMMKGPWLFDFNPLKRIKIADMNLPSHRPSRPILNNAKWKRYVGDLPRWTDSLLRYVKDLNTRIP
jgi:dTDP-4-dehydrorhamnose reductase